MGAESAEACRDSVQLFLSLPRDVQEGIVLNEGYPRHDLLPGSGLGAVLDSLLRSGRQADRERDEIAWRVGMCGGDHVLEMLRSPAGVARFGSDSARADHPITMILRRRGQAPWWSSDFFRDPAAPSDTLRAKYLTWLRAGLPARDRAAKNPWAAALAVREMSTYAPSSVESLLASIRPEEVDRRSEGFVYAVASCFGWRCNSERVERLKRLLSAPHPIVRTAAAVYLSFEDSTSSLPRLREEALNEEFSGQWASVVLASRGESRFMERALSVFANAPAGAVSEKHRNNL